MRIQGVIFISMFFLSACISRVHPPRPLPQSSSSIVSKTCVLSSFSSLVVKGPFNLKLHTGARSSSIVLHGAAQDVERVFYRVRNGVLVLKWGSSEQGISKAGVSSPINIDVYLNVLHNLKYDGYGLIEGRQLRTDSSELSIHNPGKTELMGVIHLKSLTVNGSGEFVLGWVDAGALELQTRGQGAPRIRLAGRADRLDVFLTGKAFLDARYVRARQTFVRTQGHSLAKLVSTRRQHTLASDASDIYFYNLPPYRADFMAKNGAVLDMRDWALESAQEYTPYNK